MVMPLRIASRSPRYGLFFAGFAAGGCCARRPTQAAKRTRTPNAERRTRFRLDMRGIVARPRKAGRQRAERQEFKAGRLEGRKAGRQEGQKGARTKARSVARLPAFLPSCLEFLP